MRKPYGFSICIVTKGLLLEKNSVSDLGVGKNMDFFI